MQIRAQIAVSTLGAVLGVVCVMVAVLVREVRAFFAVVGVALLGPPLLGAYYLVARGSFELTIDWKSVQWRWTGRAKSVSVSLAEVEEALFWFDNAWLLWIVLKSGERLRVPCFLSHDEREQIASELLRHAVRVRESENAVGGRPD